MFALLVVLTLIASVLLIGVVLMQKSKGGGLSSTFAGSNNIMGVRRTTNFIEKATWTLAGVICLLAILSTFFMPAAITPNQSRVNPTEQVQGGDYNTPAPEAAQASAPAPAPQPAAPAK